MITLLTVQEPQTITKIWNLVDWLAQEWKLSAGFPLGTLILFGVLVCICTAYLLGSVQTAIPISKRFFHGDIRQYGSGRADTANMLAVYGKGAAVITVVAEVLKAAAAICIGRLILEVNGGALASFFVLFGQMYPLFYRFKGGNILVCLTTVVITLDMFTFLILLVIFLVGLFGTRMLSFATVMTALLYPLVLQSFANNGLNVAMAVLTAIFVLYWHRENLKRMQVGQEEKVDFSKLFPRKKGKQ